MTVAPALRLALLLAACSVAVGAAAQSYPSRPVQIVIPFAAGGSTDRLFRIMAPVLSERLGQPAVIVNRPGGAATIGMAAVAKSAPDGYTLGVATLSFAANPPFMAGKMPFDAEKDLVPVVYVSRTPLVLIVNPGVAARSVGELIALARERPGALNYGSSGIASSGHLAGALFASMAGISMTHIPFSGTTSAGGVVAGQTQLQIAAIPASLGFIKGGQVVALGVSARTPVGMLPGVPTIDQSGVPGFEMYEWSGVMAPSGTPAAVIARLHQEIVAALNDPAVKPRIEATGGQVVGGAPRELAALIRSEIATWSKIAAELRAAGALQNN